MSAIEKTYRFLLPKRYNSDEIEREVLTSISNSQRSSLNSTPSTDAQIHHAQRKCAIRKFGIPKMYEYNVGVSGSEEVHTSLEESVLMIGSQRVSTVDGMHPSKQTPVFSKNALRLGSVYGLAGVTLAAHAYIFLKSGDLEDTLQQANHARYRIEKTSEQITDLQNMDISEYRELKHSLDDYSHFFAKLNKLERSDLLKGAVEVMRNGENSEIRREVIDMNQDGAYDVIILSGWEKLGHQNYENTMKVYSANGFELDPIKETVGAGKK